uniref:Uncharacterized protein n=1 Tax=Avena sativa TaxID=4498 RepID=A0ACD5UMT0_AVESA
MRGSNQAYAMIILFLVGLLAATFECRLEDERRSDHTNVIHTRANVINSTTSDQSKLRLKFCTWDLCGTAECFCCQILPDVPCFTKKEDCWAKCPMCNPNCPPPPA